MMGEWGGSGWDMGKLVACFVRKCFGWRHDFLHEHVPRLKMYVKY